MTPLSCFFSCQATKHGHKKIVKMLLKAGADVDVQDKHAGATALMLAVKQHLASFHPGPYSKIVGLLLGAGANVTAVTRDGETALTMATNSGRQKNRPDHPRRQGGRPAAP